MIKKKKTRNRFISKKFDEYPYSFHGGVTVGIVVGWGSVSDVEVMGVRVAVGEVPQSVCCSELGSERACLAEASVRVVNVGEVARVPFAVGESPLSVCTAVVLGRGGGSILYKKEIRNPK